MGITGLLPQAGPVRTLPASTFVNTIGNGLFMAAGALVPPVTRWAERDRPHEAARAVTPSST